MGGVDDLRGIPVSARPQPRGRVLRWRREQLVAAGYDEISAHRLAADSMVDVHAMVARQERRLLPWIETTRKDRPRGGRE
ncbi:hypothetical protein [Sphaerimonospora thailandensis]|uniref:Uncharacterized protein n=1 Tax=Sphaerimonospora thailandensis TaxID=795644 RepID=A0A8J3W2E0_9ACTN|nr:hypothetical protein [Sphaerimonospora thailandensis]GIH73160.1 hypothetical protein Mth01_54130 [Sphaerimonospora thailandensis]